MRLQPLDEKGSGVALWTDAGVPIETINIPACRKSRLTGLDKVR
ncbi:hypothetical protein ACPOL_6726 (plasmid) [Acidisarcina polymorpha]|uniref:Uncharacterized protein n=1 Tax=Acidisarcina polymorpha TaxID=2211140 RepID=A0A2Z5GAA5_9BACT|nr:hypothetical protein ACPOL_6726 [Acidisarcina polymorpha]